MQSAKVVLACVLGASLGVLIGIHFGHLWVAIIAGGILGYCLFEWRTALTAVPRAWIYTVQNWEVLRKKTWEGIVMLGMLLGLVINIVLPPFFLMEVSLWIFPHRTDIQTEHMIAFALPIAVLLMISPILHLSATLPGSNFEQDNTVFIPVYYWAYRIPKLAFRGVVWLFKHMSGALAFLGTFVAEWFRLVHSELRLLCMIDAAIGAGVGYFFHSPIIGGIVGGVAGFVNYEVLSIRVMKLVPAQQSIFARFS